MLKSHPDKLLKDHLRNVGEKSKEILIKKTLNLEFFDKKQLEDFSYIIGICHDFGKATSFFQNKLPPHNQNHTFSHHGLISALFGYVVVEKYSKFKELAMIVYILIKKHHGNLESPLEQITLVNDLKNQINNLKENERFQELEMIYSELFEILNIKFSDCFKLLEDFIINKIDNFINDEIHDIILDDISNEKGIERFLLTNLLYSILIDTDKKDAAGIETDYFQDSLIPKISVKSFLDSEKEKNPEKFNEEIEINKLRTEFFNEVINSSKICKENYLYALTAPTGIGKTFTSYGFAHQLKNLFPEGKRIIYCLPYTSIIDQNYSEIEKIIDFNIYDYQKHPAKYLIKHHHLTQLKLDDINTNIDSNETLSYSYFDQKLLLESWESANIITTFIQLFHSVIGNKNSFLKKFHNIVNSIIILDEIQTLPEKYYKLVGKVLEILAKKFNTYIVFLTATQPKIIDNKYLSEIISRDKYAKKNEFDRVDLEIRNLNQSINLDDFICQFQKEFISDTGLIVCNKVKTAINLFQKLTEIYQKKGYAVYSLTTNIIPCDRSEIIKKIKSKIKNKEKVLLISTQLIEAGVDFSFETVYRDLAPIDSIVQTAGRSNRDNELKPLKGKVIILNLSDNDKEGNSIYSPFLIQNTKTLLVQKNYTGKDFIDISNQYFFNLDNTRDSNYLLIAIYMLNYSIRGQANVWGVPINDFQLIEDAYYKEDLIICSKKEVEDKIKELENIEEEIKNNHKNITDCESLYERIDLIKKEVGNYTISVNKKELQKYSDYIDEFNNLYYVSYENFEHLYDLRQGFIFAEENKSLTKFF